MKIKNLGNYKTVNSFVAKKLKKLEKMPKNFNSLFELMFSERNNIFFEYSDGYKIKKITYEQSFNHILKFYKVLKTLPTQKKSLFAGIYMNNCVEWIEIFWALLLCGFNPVLLNLRLDDETTENILQKLDVDFVISDKKEFSVQTFNITQIKKLAEDDNSQTENFSISQVQMGTDVLLLSSGTSSNVKICSYTAEQFYYLIKGSFGIIKKSKLIKKHYQGELKLLTFLPFYHIFGFIAVYLWFAFFSRTFVLLNDFSSDTIINTIRRHKVTHIFCVPLFWNTVYEKAIKTIKNRGEKTYSKFQKGLKLAQKPIIGKFITKFALKEVRENLFGESICFMISGGSFISKEVLQFFNSIGYHLSNGYGMTEIGITSVELSSNVKEVSKGSVGNPMDSVEYKINDENELLIRGKSLANYIIDNSGKHNFSEDWFNTKDLASQKNGKFYILGRKDDLIISTSGENLNPNLIENKFNFSGIQNCCLTYLKSEQQKQIVLLISVSPFIKQQKFEEIYKNCKEKISELKLSGEIKKILFTTQPLISGDEFKVNRKKIKENLENNKISLLDFSKFDAKNDEKIQSELENQIAQIFADCLEKNLSEISLNGDFFLDYNGSSLDYFAMIYKIQQKFNVELPISKENSLNSVKSIANFIRNSL